MSEMAKIESILLQDYNNRCVLYLSNEKTIELKTHEMPSWIKPGHFVKHDGDELTFYVTNKPGEVQITDFGEALRWLREGRLVARRGWNGKGMFLYYVKSSSFAVSRPPLLGIFPEGTIVDYHAHIDMKTATGECVPWLASQTDLLALDWEIVDV